MSSIPVLAAVIQRNNRYLICKRPSHKRHGNLWEFPGGKLEPYETLLAAANRELTEELRVSALAVGEPLFSIADPGSPFLIEFVPTVIEGEPTCLEHTELRWATLDELPSLPLAPSDRKFVDYLLAKAGTSAGQP
jgi:8-oxo-dGTP diphosphatase